LKKKIIVVAGGFDVAKYGSMSSFWKSILVRLMLKFSDKVLAVSYSNRKEVIDNCKIDPSKIEMVYHGFEEINQQINLSKKINTIVTVGIIDTGAYYRKGIDRFLKLAKVLKNIEFHLIGKVDLNFDIIPLPKNVILHGYLDLRSEKFNTLLKSAKIYIQFSTHESFGCSVAEAMQYGCIPVISDSYSLPEVVGDCGLIIKNFKDYEHIASQVKGLMENYNQNLSIKCIERVKNIFSYKERAAKIISIINNLNSNY
jgi:glycosyltransferase involved in cell wall biosynthesis